MEVFQNKKQTLIYSGMTASPLFYQSFVDYYAQGLLAALSHNLLDVCRAGDVEMYFLMFLHCFL